jgi:hypothetical protein
VHICIFYIQFRWSFCTSRIQFIVLEPYVGLYRCLNAVPNAANLEPTCQCCLQPGPTHLTLTYQRNAHPTTTRQSLIVRFISDGHVHLEPLFSRVRLRHATQVGCVRGTGHFRSASFRFCDFASARLRNGVRFIGWVGLVGGAARWSR